MKLSKEEINDIAQSLECGFVCYINKKTKEVIEMIDFDVHYGEETEPWEEDMKKIKENEEDYIRIKPMWTRESFKVMEAFTYEVTNSAIRQRLEYVLSRGKPFRNFKYEVDNNEAIRQQWFKFRTRKNEEYIKNLIELTQEEETNLSNDIF